MALPKHVEKYAIPMGRVQLEVHTQPNGDKNYWLFSSVAAIELQEEDIGELGSLFKSYYEEKIDRYKLWSKRALWVLFPLVFLSIGYLIGAS